MVDNRRICPPLNKQLGEWKMVLICCNKKGRDTSVRQLQTQKKKQVLINYLYSRITSGIHLPTCGMHVNKRCMKNIYDAVTFYKNIWCCDILFACCHNYNFLTRLTSQPASRSICAIPRYPYVAAACKGPCCTPWLTMILGWLRRMHTISSHPVVQATHSGVLPSLFGRLTSQPVQTGWQIY